RLDGGAGSFPLPGWSLRLGGTPATVRYVFLGDPDFRDPRPPWRYVERMGDYHRVEAGDVRVTIVTRRRAGLTEASFLVEPPAGRVGGGGGGGGGAPGGAPAPPPLGADPRDDHERHADERPRRRRLVQPDQADDQRDRGLEAHQRPERGGREPPQREHLQRERD